MPVDTMTRVRRMDGRDLDDVLAWRNHADVRRWMHQQEEIPREMHEAWFARCSADPSQALLIIEEAGQPIGFVRLSDIRDGVAEWGFYKVPGSPSGTGLRMGLAALEYGFLHLGLERVTACVLACNKRSLHFHRKLGFSPASPAAPASGTEHFLLDRSRWLGGNHS